MLLIPSFAYFVANIDDVVEATDGLYMCGIITMVISMKCFYTMHCTEVEDILQQLQVTVTLSKTNFICIFSFCTLH